VATRSSGWLRGVADSVCRDGASLEAYPGPRHGEAVDDGAVDGERVGGAALADGGSGVLEELATD
jgi:hypothetical protein